MYRTFLVQDRSYLSGPYAGAYFRQTTLSRLPGPGDITSSCLPDLGDIPSSRLSVRSRRRRPPSRTSPVRQPARRFDNPSTHRDAIAVRTTRKHGRVSRVLSRSLPSPLSISLPPLPPAPLVPARGGWDGRHAARAERGAQRTEQGKSERGRWDEKGTGHTGLTGVSSTPCQLRERQGQ